MPTDVSAIKLSRLVRALILSAVLLPAATVLSGCPAGTYGSIISPAQVATITRGRTTKAELLRTLGEPDKATQLALGQEELCYVREIIAPHSSWLTSQKTEFWVLLDHNVVVAFGERDTRDSPEYFKFW